MCGTDSTCQISQDLGALSEGLDALSHDLLAVGNCVPFGPLSQGLDALSHDLGALSHDLLTDGDCGDGSKRHTWSKRHTSVVARIVDLKEGETGRFDRNRREQGERLGGRHRQRRSRRGSGRKSRSARWSPRRCGAG